MNMPTSPLPVDFEVACPAEHAFSVWTSGLGTWWPPDHTMTGRAEEVVLQGGVGGRIYERTADGAEHDWGEVTVWQPPARLAYLWYLGRDRAGATEVEIRFLARGAGATRVEIEQAGWERLGDAGPARREGNRTGWGAVVPHFVDTFDPAADHQVGRTGNAERGDS